MRESTIGKLNDYHESGSFNFGGVGVHCRYDGPDEGGFWYAYGLDEDLVPIQGVGGRLYPATTRGQVVLDLLEVNLDSGLPLCLASYGGRSFNVISD